MNINELMVGDIVRNTYKKEVIRWSCLDMFSSPFKMVSGDDIEPVGITRGFLEANGFVFMSNVSDEKPYDLDEEGNAYCQFGELGIDSPHIWFWYKDGEILIPGNSTMYMRKKYVHELQQVMRCCGLREYADNLKITQ